MKITITIILIIIGIAVIAGLAYYGWGFVRELLFVSEESPVGVTDESPTVLRQVFQNPAINYWLGYYIDFEGNIIKVGGSEEEVVGRVNAAPILSVLPSQSGIEAVVAFGNPHNPQFSVFNASTTEWRPLGPETRAIAWSPDGLRLASIESINGVTSIFTSGANGNKGNKIMDISLVDVGLEWIYENKILITEKPSALLTGSIWVIDVKNKTIQLAAEAKGLILKQHQNKGIMFSVVDGFPLIELKTTDKDLPTIRLPFITLPEKCTIGDTNLYCAAPVNITDKILLPDDYLKKKFYSDDVIYEYALDKKSIRTIFRLSQDSAIDAINLKIIGDKLFFINRYDNYVYSIDLESADLE